MADDKSKVGPTYRRLAPRNETYEVDYFARKHGISPAQARELIDRVGNSRQELDAAAEALRPSD